VLTELLNYFAARGPLLRNAATQLVGRMQSDLSIRIVPQSHDGFLAGLGLYQGRPDKGLRLTNCIWVDIMRREALTEVLTNDAHFNQEGFCCLLRR